MKIKLNDPPRKFKVGRNGSIEISDCGTISLEPEEQITFVTKTGSQYDVAKKSWGYYAAPSLNGRLLEFGLRPALVTNKSTGRFFILLVERNKDQEFEKYLADETLTLVFWLHDPLVLEKIAAVET